MRRNILSKSRDQIGCFNFKISINSREGSCIEVQLPWDLNVYFMACVKIRY